ncbi:MAG TPA: MFS transporter [Acetobacteraceae bacterium]|nr:MFS transporter [Acetobacteraceae bacterium]
MTLSRRLSLVIGLTQLISWATTYYVPAVVTGAASKSIGASPTALLGAFSWALLLTGLASPRVGRRIELLGGRGVLAAGNVVMAAGLGLMAAWPTLPGWYAGWTVAGLGMALGLYDPAFATIGRLLGPAARPAIVGVTLFGGFASTVGWPLGVAFVGLLGWRGTLGAYAAILIGLNVPLLLALVPRAAGGPWSANAPETAEAPPRGGLLMFVLLAAFFALRSGISAVVSVHALRLFHGLGLGAAAAVGVASLIGPMQVGGRLAEVAAGRRLDPLTTSWLGAALLPLGVAALLAGGPATVFAITYGMSNGILTISRGTLPMYLFGPRGYAVRIGQLALPVMLTQAVTPTAISPLVLAWPATSLFALLGIAAALALACLLVVCRMGRSPRPV